MAGRAWFMVLQTSVRATNHGAPSLLSPTKTHPPGDGEIVILSHSLIAARQVRGARAGMRMAIFTLAKAPTVD
uniref:Putative secreted protein n=1 Tax=Anopheles triannulatus TaxID=58253 RepID=A0A2M4B6B9_9DIPT